jgi:hypothetical protein
MKPDDCMNRTPGDPPDVKIQFSRSFDSLKPKIKSFSCPSPKAKLCTRSSKQPMRVGLPTSDTAVSSSPISMIVGGGSSRGGSSSGNGSGPLMRALVKSHNEVQSELDVLKSKTAPTPGITEIRDLIKNAVADQLQSVTEQLKTIVDDQVKPISARVEAQHEQLKKYDEWQDHMRGHIDAQVAGMASKMEKQHLENSRNFEHITKMLANLPRQTRSGSISRSSSSSGGNQQGTGTSTSTNTHTGESTIHQGGDNTQQ